MKKKIEMFNHDSHDKPPQKTFIHYALKMALDEINTLSDTLGAIQPSKYEVEKDTIACLAFLIHEKIHDIRGLMEEMLKEKRSFGLD
jgi:hypothetical protein